MSQWFSRKLGPALAIAMLLALVLPLAAVADDISNTLDASIDAVAETMPLNAGGANGTTQLYVTPRNGDGKSGCNLTGDTTLVVSVSSSNPGVATVSPSSVTFTSCGDIEMLTVTPVTQGSATISLSQTSNSTGGTFNLAPAAFTVNVAPPANTAPTVSVAGVTGGASYNKGSVPAATCQVTDAEDGNSSFPATLSAITGPYAADGIGSQTASCSYTDQGGLTAVASETYSIVDPSAPAISYVLTPTMPDGSNGWHRSNVTLTWTVSEPESPNSLEKTGCVDQSIIADQAATTYSCSATSAGGSAGPVEVTIKRDTTAPTLIQGTTTGTLGGDGWYRTSVSVAFTTSDALSGLANDGDAAFSLVANGNGAAVATDSRTVFDAAGNSATAGPLTFKIDTAAPTLSGAPTTAANGNGWHNSNVTIHWTCSDQLGLSGIDGACPADEVISEEGTGLTRSNSVSDVAGNTTNATSSPAVNIDKTVPTISGSASPAPNANGWNNTDVTVSFSCADTLSGVATCSADTTLSEGAGQSVSGTAVDNAGNSAGATVSNINIDKTAPSVALVGGPAHGASYYFGSVPVAPTCSASDGLSGIDGACTVSGYSAAVGTHTVKASVKDMAGNTSEATATYTVLAWTITGFYQPVDMNTLNNAKAGSTVPLKFEVFAGSTELTSTSIVSSFTQKISCVSGTGDDIEQYATGSTTLRYDATSGQFIFNWQTPKATGSCYRVSLSTQDGSSISADFRLK
jgi:hypothetical protein